MSAVLNEDALTFDLNQQEVSVQSAPLTRLSEVLREELGARDVKVGCNAGDCGACTVLLDGEAVCSCMVPVGRLAATKIETLSGLVRQDPLAEKLKASFAAHGAAQCGICTPGIMVSALALLRQVPHPTADQVKDALGGVLCRCTGYIKIIDAVCGAVAGVLPRTEPLTRDATGGGQTAVGDAVARLDGEAKLTGLELFGDDVAPADALVLKIIRSPHHRAGFTFGDLEGYLASQPGLALVLTARDIPGDNHFSVIPAFSDQPVFAEGEARYRGEAVAAVVGEASVMADLDLTAFPVSWEELPAALVPAEAEAPDAALLHEDRPGNLMTGGFVQKGDVDQGLADANLMVEGRYETSFVEHAYIEPEAGFARRVGDRIEIHACTQAPFMDRDETAKIMGLAPEQIRIVPTATGGGFGSKLDISLQPYVALAAWKLDRPVRVTYSRSESMAATTKRHPAEIHLKIGVDAEGRVTAFDFNGTFNTGAYSSWGPTVANRVPVHASGPYAIENYRARSRAIHTNCPPSGAFRGFGVPQSAVAQECLFDELADKLGQDRLEFRLRNALTNGVPTGTGQVFEKGVGITACFEGLKPHWQRALEEIDAWNASQSDGNRRRGVGIAGGWYGCGNTSLPNPSTIKSGITADGKVVLHQGAMDIGQGANTVIAQIFADALGVPLSQVELIGGDTDITPDAGKTSASRQTFVSGNAARLSGEALRAEILRHANLSSDASIQMAEGCIHLREDGVSHQLQLAQLPVNEQGYVLMAVESYDPPTLPLDENGQGVPYAVFGYAAHMMELEVDQALGTVRLLKLTAAHDVGRAINPQLVEGQVEGGAAQGIGMALMEEYLPGRTENLHDYLIPTIGDMPPVETLIIEEEDAHGPYGAKGLGEHVLIPTAPAILNAIRHATGAEITRLPAMPDRVRAAIKAQQKNKS
ncbi:molybdopterin-dependent oxidoreductase [Rhodovibrionaceae bacterium A322]